MLFESPAGPTPSARRRARPTCGPCSARSRCCRRGTTCVQDDAFLMPYPEPEIIDAVACRPTRTAGSGPPSRSISPSCPRPRSSRSWRSRRRRPARQFDAAAPASPPTAARGVRPPDLAPGTAPRTAGSAAAVSISAPQRVSLDYFAALDDLAERHGLPLYAHMLETKVAARADDRAAALRRPLARPIHRRRGLLKPHTNVIHAVWVDDADLDLIADAGSTVAHNPVSNLRLGSGVMPWRAMLDRGIPVALGIDEAICDDSINVWTGRQDRRPDPQRLRAGQRRLAHARRGSRRAVAGRRPGQPGATTSAPSRPACSPTWR